MWYFRGNALLGVLRRTTTGEGSAIRTTLQAAARLWARVPLPVGPAVAVLGYHRVDDGGSGLEVSPAAFVRHMSLLAVERASLPVLGLDDALDRLAARSLPRRAVVVTFDDAWADNHDHALGPLVDNAIPATLYVPSRLLDTAHHLSRGQLVEMVDAGISVGAHSRTHPDLRKCSDGELEAEIRGSRDDLEDLLGRPVTSFAYPAGLHDDRVVAAVATVGYRSAITTRRGWLREGADLLRIPRSFIEEMDQATFRAAAQGGLNALAPLDAARIRLGSR